MAINEVSVSPQVEDESANRDLRGSLWRHKDGDIYVIAQTGVLEYQLVSLVDGNRWGEPAPENGNPFDNERDEFTRIPPGSTVSIVVGEG